MNIKKATILEAIDDDFFDKGISADELKRRKLTIARVLEQAEKAVKKAEETGQSDIADKLKDRIDTLQELFDRAEELSNTEDETTDGVDSSDTTDEVSSEDKDSGSGDSDSDSESTGGKDGDVGSPDNPDNKSDKETTDEDDSSDDEDEDSDVESPTEITSPGADDSSKTDDKSSDQDKKDNEGSDSSMDGDKTTGGSGKPSGTGNDENGQESDSDEGTKSSDADDSETTNDTKKNSDGDSTGGTGVDSKGEKTSSEDSDSRDDDSGEDTDDAIDPEKSDSDKSSKDSSGTSSEDSSEGSGDDDDDDDDDEYGEDEGDGTASSDGKIRINPFAKGDPDNDSFDPGEQEVETVFDAAKRILGKLSGESKRGAVAGLKDILKNRGIDVLENLSNKKVLHEKLSKTLSKMSEDEFNSEISSTLDLIDKILKIDYVDDMEARIKEIKRDASSRVARAELEKEDSSYVNADKKAIKSLDRENDKFGKIKGLRGLEAFEASLYKAVADQVEQAEEDEESWSAINRRHEDDPTIIKKGNIIDDGDTEIPSVYVYFDQSGSWTDEHIKIGMSAISTINEFHENGQIKLKIFYMAGSSVYNTAEEARRHYYAEGWHAALQHIRSSNAKNVVILSDSDLDHPGLERYNRPTGSNGRTVVDGCVWWLWKDGYTAPKSMKELIGRSGNFEYQFSS